MYFDNAEGPVFRPPSEAHSFILRVTVGCSHNACTYCNMYKSVQFRTRPMNEIMDQIHAAKPYAMHIRRIFLADGNALVLATDKLLAILDALARTFPRLQRVACYAGPRDMLNKTPAELEALKAAGLKLVYYGLESGDDVVLSRVNKGVTAAESIEAGQRIVAAGIKLSVMIIAGLGGKEHSARHAANTARVVNAIRPQMLSALTLMLYRGSELLEQFESGRFAPLSPAEIMGELYELVSGIDLPPAEHCLFRSNHISNHIALAATLPKDKDRLLDDIAAARKELADVTDWDPYNNVE
ncbi:radical SAM protein [Sporomusa sphaeroides]|uniref:Coproporphyrinogen III oxidase n=2 Tax=Sporomusa TaxID=2375 RepID=A0ABM9WA18_9FIRM|nr:radical SAM protein [Sporomusa sphaeroides]OLS55393.1 coproporphyrinogen III oxidase [Sporomusa sphaeroides DSM 2875]CVK21419.1 coproporphyrinogen III oxidase [Sporomusa sphaeroides DSM 2875]SCM83487.1 Fe-S oxidoreductase [uncultured Sporomusa sp.]